MMPMTTHTPLRLLIVMPSWVGDVVMATPAVRLLRRQLPGIFIGGLVRPGMDELLAGSDFFDEVHVERSSGVFGPKFIAAKLRPRRYDTALLLTNSFSTALVARIAGIPRRMGYDRDARGLLLTDRLEAPRRADGTWAPVPAAAYYFNAARRLLQMGGRDGGGPGDPFALPDVRMELATTPDQERAGVELLARAGIAPDAPMAILNPGGNNPAKRWPAERFAALGRELALGHGLSILVSGSPGEKELTSRIAAEVGLGIRDGGPRVADLASLGVELGSLKAVIRRCRLMVTNDTGPRHIAAAFGVPVVSLFGPTDPRWTTIPVAPGAEAELVVDPTLPEALVADDYPDRCRVERIELSAVIEAAKGLLAADTGGLGQRS